MVYIPIANEITEQVSDLLEWDSNHSYRDRSEDKKQRTNRE
jgi:hypothetical protein